MYTNDLRPSERKLLEMIQPGGSSRGKECDETRRPQRPAPPPRGTASGGGPPTPPPAVSGGGDNGKSGGGEGGSGGGVKKWLEDNKLATLFLGLLLLTTFTAIGNQIWVYYTRQSIQLVKELNDAESSPAKVAVPRVVPAKVPVPPAVQCQSPAPGATLFWQPLSLSPGSCVELAPPANGSMYFWATFSAVPKSMEGVSEIKSARDAGGQDIVPTGGCQGSNCQDFIRNHLGQSLFVRQVSNENLHIKL